MKRLMFLLLLIPIFLLSWAQRPCRPFGEEYVVEEKVDSLRYTAVNTFSWTRRDVNSTRTYLEWQLNVPGHMLIAHHLFSKLFYDGAEKVYIDSLKVTFYHGAIDSSDTFYVRIDTLTNSITMNWHPFKTLQIPEYTSNNAIDEVTFFDFEIKQPEKFAIVWWMKTEGTPTWLTPRWVIVFYKAYYKVR